MMGGIACPEGPGNIPTCPDGNPCECIDVDGTCEDGDDDWGYWSTDWSDDESMEWEWYLEEASDLLPQDGDSWSIGPVTVTYNDAASKLVATVGAVILATALAQ